MNTKEIFNKEIEVPDIVLRKAQAAFADIRKEVSASDGAPETASAVYAENMDMTQKTKRRLFKSGWALAACIALIALLGVTVFAAINHFWSDGMNEVLSGDETQIRQLEDTGMAVLQDESMAVTTDGITICPMEMVSDGHQAYLSFLMTGVEAYAGPEEEIHFSSWKIQTVPDTPLNMSDGFYDGQVTDADGNPAREYVMTIYSNEDNGLLGKTLHVELADLAPAAGKAELGDAFAKGPWTFDLALPSETGSVTYDINQPLEDSVYTVRSIEATPISLRIDYTLSGEPEIWREDNNIPMVVAITLKDGTVIDNSDESARPLIDGLARSFYEAEDGSARATGNVELARIIDPQELASVTFREFSEAIAWGAVPDEAVAEEYGGEIPFERVYPGEEHFWTVEIKG